MGRTTRLLVVCGCAAFLVACGRSSAPNKADGRADGDLATIQSRGELVIATRNAPTIWYIDRDGRAVGPEHDLAAAFARHLGVKARFVVLDSVEAMLEAVADGKADMAAGSITRTRARRQQFLFGPGYAEVSQEVVCNRAHKPRNVADLGKVDSLVVAADTSYASLLSRLARQHPDYGLHWSEAKDTGTESLLAQVAQGKIGCTIADSNIVAINRRYHPSLLVMFRISRTQHLAWPMPRGARSLQSAARQWLAGYRKAGKLAALHERYYGFVRKWNFVDKNTLVDRIKNVYPRFKEYFAEAANKYGFGKWLLAAQAYQESRWNPHAVSHTGVRGMMMLTTPTADALGVDRLNAKQSIMGGAEYLRKMAKKLPQSIAPPARAYFALAAYNIGYYHLRDAMRLTKKRGLDPHSWVDVRATLPLLMQKKYYRHLRYGYARGREAVRYVRRIRDYSDIIHRVATFDQKLATSNGADS